jgi:glucose-6-phosphate isomerase
VASSSLWQRFQQYFLYHRNLDFSLDISRMKFSEDFFEKMQPKIERAFGRMRELEAGAIANPTEKRVVGQLVMESLGKKNDLDGKVVHQGIAVSGKKDSTDQHAYVQQLRDGLLNFFVTFIEVDKDRHNPAIKIEDGIKSGDYLHGFLRGTRSALYESGRESITMSIPEVNAFNLGVLIALYERAVGFYGSLINVNTCGQPGVEAGKKAASKLLPLQKQVSEKLAADRGQTAGEIARSIDADPEAVFHVRRHLASNDPQIKVVPGEATVDVRFSLGEKA